MPLASLKAHTFAGLLAASAGITLPTPQDNPSFRDVSIELRCAALSNFVNDFAMKWLDIHGFNEIGCSEGNGIGGATYELEFRLKAAPDIRAYTAQIAIPESAQPETRICLHASSDTICTKNFSSPPRADEPHFAVAGKESAFAEKNYQGVNTHLPKLLIELASWVSSEQKFNRIYGTDYGQFISTLINRSMKVPVSSKGQSLFLEMQLQRSAASAAQGTVKILSDLPSDIQTCLGCNDKTCSKDELHYTFNNRFLAVTKKTVGEKEKTNLYPDDKAKVGLAWVMNGPKPMDKSEPAWRFFCGISRYSVQLVK